MASLVAGAESLSWEVGANAASAATPVSYSTGIGMAGACSRSAVTVAPVRIPGW
jgi:hypothetical protein